MKIIFRGLPALLTLIAVPCFAQADSGPHFFGNLQQGDWHTGGSFSFNDRMPDGRDSYLNINLSVPVEYFFADRFSAGMNVFYARQGRAATHDLGIGPSLSYYFYAQDRLAASIGQRVDVDFFEDGTNQWNETTSLTMEYFITPVVAIGPQLGFTHLFGNSDYLSTNVLSFSGSFSLFF